MHKSDIWIQKHFERLVEHHPGQWAVIIGDRLIGISNSLPKLTKTARAKFPNKIPTIFKIPRRRDLVCALNFNIRFFME